MRKKQTYDSIFMNLGDTMQRYFIKNNQIQVDDLHHIKHVMRMKTGDMVELCDETGVCYLAQLNLDSNPISFVKMNVINQDEAKPQVTLIQGIGKGDKNEFVVKYATQFGADEIIFVEMKRSIAKMDHESFEKKKERYQKIAVESARLAHRNTVPVVSFLSNLKQLNHSYKYAYIAYENTKNVTFLDKLLAIKKAESITLLIGPEGGIDESEIALLNDKGFITVGLGNRILQTEVASLYGLSLIDAVLEAKR